MRRGRAYIDREPRAIPSHTLGAHAGSDSGAESPPNGTLLTDLVSRSYPQAVVYPEDSTDANWDSADATRGYPEDSTDESNSLRLITFN